MDRFFLVDLLNVSVRDHIAKELVSNILVHREYSSPVPGRIIVEEDRIIAENWNRPQRPGRITPDNFVPYPKNPLLANFYVQIGYADTLGSGVRNLYRYSLLYSGKEPELIEGDVFKTIVPITRAAGVNTVNETVNETDKALRGGTEATKMILQAISENPRVSYGDISQSFGINRSTVYRAIKVLKETGIIQRVGSDKTGYWQIIK